MGPVRATIDPDAFVWALGAMCRLHRLPFDPGLTLSEFVPPYRFEHLPRAARALGLRARMTKLDQARLKNGQLPCVVALRPHAGEAANAEIGIVVGADRDAVELMLPGGERSPLSRTAFGQRVCGDAVHFRRTEDAPAGDEEGEARRFGFGWFVPELLKHRAVWRDLVLASLAIQAMALLTPLLAQAVIDRVIAHQATSTLWAIAIALALLIAFTGAMSWSRQVLLLHTGNRIDAILAGRVFEHLLALPARYFERRPTGTLIARLQGIETIRDFLTGAAVGLVLDLPFLAVFLAVMAYYSASLTGVVAALLALMAAASLAVAPLMRRRLNEQFLLGARNQAFLTEFVAGMATVKSLQMEPQLRARYAEYVSSLLSAGFRTRQLANGYGIGVQSLEQLIALAVLCLGALEVMRNDGFTVGMLVAFQMFASRLTQPLARLAALWQDFQQAGIAVRRLGDVMDAPAEPVSLAAQPGAQAQARLEVEGVWFRHSERSPELFHGLSFAVEPGECVAITGPSGSGKSTLVALLQAVYAPAAGRIRLNGRDLRAMPVNEIRAVLGVVPQETVLFSGTVWENLLLGNPHAGIDDMVHACRLAGIHETIEALPEGYHTRVGEHGVGLSGGQRQRIAIARALLKRTKLLIFDEPTSQLDARTAAALHATLGRLRGRVSVVIVSHEAPDGLALDRSIALGERVLHQVRR